MFGGLHLLGEAPEVDEVSPGGSPDWLEPKMPEGEIDMISVAYYSPDAGYPYQRLENYNVSLAEQGAQLNGVGMVSKMPTRRRNYLMSVMSPRLRF